MRRDVADPDRHDDEDQDEHRREAQEPAAETAPPGAAVGPARPPSFTDVAEPGDVLEVRGPIGGYFVGTPTAAGRSRWSQAGRAWCR